MEPPLIAVFYGATPLAVFYGTTSFNRHHQLQDFLFCQVSTRCTVLQSLARISSCSSMTWLRWIPPGFTSTFSACLDKPLYSCSSVSSLLFFQVRENEETICLHMYNVRNTLPTLHGMHDVITVRAHSKWNQALSPLQGVDSSTRNISALTILTWGTKVFKMLANHHQWKVQSKVSPTICSLPAFQ